ncbi:MAG: biotin transporter BioY [Candidatus Omnitrophica bacterium]|nr:biotin transporter BioY [Candidatus Omnitrophota bacterium]
MKILTVNQNSVAGEWLGVLLFTPLMIIASYVRIPLPFTPVPFTLQTFVLFLSIAFLRKKAGLAYAIYILLGLCGLPVFANAGSGLAYLFGPTAGYLTGFFIMLLIFPYFLPREKSFLKMFFFFIFASLVYFTLGALWLMSMYHLELTAAISTGVLPFIAGDIIKAGIASTICLKTRI